MKRFSAAALVTLALALAIRTFFHLSFPEVCLTDEGTSVVVAVCAMVVLSSKRMWTSLRKRKIRPVREP